MRVKGSGFCDQVRRVNGSSGFCGQVHVHVMRVKGSSGISDLVRGLSYVTNQIIEMFRYTLQQ